MTTFFKAMNHLVHVLQSDMPNRIKNHLTELVGATTSLLGAIAAWQEQLDWALRCAASVIAIVAGVASLYAFFRNRNKNNRVVSALLSVAEDKSEPEDKRKAAKEFVEKLVQNKTIHPEDLQ